MLPRLIALLLFLLPFQWALNPAPGMDLPLGRAISISIILWWLAEGLAKRRFPLPPLWITAGLLSFLFLAVTSLLWAENTSFALRKILFLLNFFPLGFVFFDLGREWTTRRLWLNATVGGSALAASMAVCLFFSQFILGLNPALRFVERALPFFLGPNLGQSILQYSSLLVNVSGETWLRATGVFPDPHIASFFFGMTGFLTFGLYLDRPWRGYLVFATILFAADLLTFSRGGYIGLIAGATAFLALGWRYFSHEMKRSLGIVLFAAALLLVLAGQPIVSRFVSSFSLADSSSVDRLSLWRTAVENIAERPFLGTGLGNYIVEVLPTAEYRTPYYAHNLYLDIAVELGLLGLFFFLLLFVWSYSNVLTYPSEAHLNERRQENMRITRSGSTLAVAAALTLYLTHSFFETALFSVHILPLLALTLSLAWYDGDAYEASC